MFTIFVSHSQLAVFIKDLDQPFNDWSTMHVAQGFSWRPGSVSFATLVESGNVDVLVQELMSVPKFEGERVISVPFHVDAEGVEIASILESHVVPIKAGDYQLLFETGWQNKTYWCRFTFIRDGDPSPRIIVQDQVLSPSLPLNMEAHAAG